ncbi:cytochrome P450 [Sordaria brevicollis]|uniref:Cytochrome P450 n=1 Tax=Sordaria brevicollis TaxID=83679 RepID=A0AAE0UCI8_SORBR|nr:cytochrome P450 [Sordaria brevicollis]
MSSVLPITLLTLLVVLLVVQRWLERRRLPPGVKPLPGPTNLPFIGRVHDVPEKGSWIKFYEWSKVYGPIYQTKMFGVTHVWISSEKIAHDLLSKRANIYSDRPLIPNLPDNRTSGDYLALLGRNDTWKRQRKLCNHLMHTSSLASLHDYPTLERNRFLYLLSQSPEDYIEYIEQFTSRTVSRLSWGSAHPAQILRHTTFGLLETISPSGALPNIISFLRHLPLALSPWQKKEKARHDLENKQFHSNVGFVRRMMALDRAEPSFIRTFLEEQASSLKSATKGEEEKQKEADEAMHVVGLMAIAGALTIGSPIQSYILAMCHYPEWQAKLQEEIDRELGGRCPMWEDREKLPLLRAVVKEVIRWRPAVPTGIPHAIEKDDVYEGYFIPAGATIHALEWGITRDEQFYPDAETFNPSRFLLPSYPTYREPLTTYPNLSGFSQFGFGRRTCQGIPIVEQDLFLTMGGMAWAFTITKKRDPATGKEIPVHWNDYTPLLIAKPCRFPFDAIPRGEHKMRKMREMYDEATEGEEAEKEESSEERERTEKWMEGIKMERGEEIPWQTAHDVVDSGAPATEATTGVTAAPVTAIIAPGTSGPGTVVSVAPVVNVDLDVTVVNAGSSGTATDDQPQVHLHTHTYTQPQDQQPPLPKLHAHQPEVLPHPHPHPKPQSHPQSQPLQLPHQQDIPAALVVEHQDPSPSLSSLSKSTSNSRIPSRAPSTRSVAPSITGSATSGTSATSGGSWAGCSEPSLSFRGSSAESSDCEERDVHHRPSAEEDMETETRRKRVRIIKATSSNASSTTIEERFGGKDTSMELGIGIGLGVVDGMETNEMVPGAWRW